MANKRMEVWELCDSWKTEWFLDNSVKKVQDNFKDLHFECLEENNFEKMIRDIKTYEDLSDFVKIFKWNSEKLSLKYFTIFIDQFYKYIDNVEINSKMHIFADVFWVPFQGNQYDPYWDKFTKIIMKDDNFDAFCSIGIRFYYLGNRLLKYPTTLDELSKMSLTDILFNE